MSQESTKEPAFVLEGGCCFVAAVYIKKNRRKWMQASLPHFSPVSFSACFAHSRSCAPQTAAVVRSAFGCRRFFCGKNEREEAPLRRRDSEARSFRRSETAVPRRRYHTSSRQARTAVPSGCTKCAEKERGDHRGELARIRGIHSLFLLACRNTPTQRLSFGWVLGERNPPLPFGR